MPTVVIDLTNSTSVCIMVIWIKLDSIKNYKKAPKL